MATAQFLGDLIAMVRYRIHIVLTDNGIRCINRKNDSDAFRHTFGRACEDNGIEHRPTRANHPWTNRQIERMHRTLKDPTVKCYHYAGHDHLATLVAGDKPSRRPKTLKGLTPYEPICKAGESQPERFGLDHIHQMPSLNTLE